MSSTSAVRRAPVGEPGELVCTPPVSVHADGVLERSRRDRVSRGVLRDLPGRLASRRLGQSDRGTAASSSAAAATRRSIPAACGSAPRRSIARSRRSRRWSRASWSASSSRRRRQAIERIVLFVRLRDGVAFSTKHLSAAIRRRIRAGTSPHHVPRVIVQVTDLPRTRSGKLSELAVRDVIEGRAVKNVGALANPEALEQFRNRPELTQAVAPRSRISFPAVATRKRPARAGGIRCRQSPRYRARPDHHQGPVHRAGQGRGPALHRAAVRALLRRRTTRPGATCTPGCTTAGRSTPTTASSQGIENLCLSPDRVPRLEDVNKFMAPLTGFRAKAVSGYVPAYMFFDCLRQREFPTTITIRDGQVLDYLPEPDIFHDIAGHVPMHTDKAFADTLVLFGECARAAAERASDDCRRARAGPAHDQRDQGDGALLLVHDRVRPDEGQPGPARSRRMAAGCCRRTARSSTASNRPTCSAIRSSWSGWSTSTSRSTTTSRCCSSWIRSTTCSPRSAGSPSG